MSTVPEPLIARRLGVGVQALWMITNMAAGPSMRKTPAAGRGGA